MKDQKQQVQPNRWHTEQRWRCPLPGDRKGAAQVRQALVALKLYPRCDLAKNDNLAIWEANRRAALPDMLAELDRTDLIVVSSLVRLLALVPREPGLFRGRGCPGK